MSRTNLQLHTLSDYFGKTISVLVLLGMLFSCGCGGRPAPAVKPKDLSAAKKLLAESGSQKYALEIDRAYHLLEGGRPRRPFIFAAEARIRGGGLEMNVWALKGESDVREMHLMYISPNDTRGKRVIYRSNHPLGIPVKSSMIRWLAPVVFGDRTRLSVVANIGVSEQRIEGKKKEITRDMPAIVSSKHKFKEWFQRGNVYVRFVDENGQRSNNLRVDASLLDFDKIPDCSPRWEMKKYIDPPVRAFPDSPPPNGYWAARLGRIRQIKDAIKTNSRATRQVFDTGATLLHLASEGGHCDVAVYLIEHGASVEAENVWGDTPLHKAARAGEQELVTVLLDNGARASPTADDGRRPIHNAAIEGYQNVVRLLLNKGADVNVTNIAGRTPLHCAAGADELSTARVLLENGANVNPKTIRGETPLLSGLRWSKKGKVTHLLLVKGAKLETDKAGMGPLHYASERAFLGIVELLLAKNADVNAQSKKGKTPLHRASVENGYIIVRTLLTAGADPNIPDQFGRTVKDKFSTYKNCPDDIWASDESLFSAAYGGNTERVRQMIDSNTADVNMQDKAGRTPLHWAAMGGAEKVIRLLLQKGAPVGSKDQAGFTALQLAVASNNLSVVRRLIMAGAKPEIEDPAGLSLREYDCPIQIQRLLRQGNKEGL